jgi:hypothetical protein
MFAYKDFDSSLGCFRKPLWNVFTAWDILEVHILILFHWQATFFISLHLLLFISLYREDTLILERQISPHAILFINCWDSDIRVYVSFPHELLTVAISKVMTLGSIFFPKKELLQNFIISKWIYDCEIPSIKTGRDSSLNVTGKSW